MALFALSLLVSLGFCYGQTNKWETDIAAFEASDRTNRPPKSPLVFVGSSSIRLWKTLAQDFPKHHVVNRGFGGSEISDSVQFADRIVIPYRPRLIVMYAGGNDIHNGKSPETVFNDFKAFVAKVHALLPKTRIAYISIAPNPARWSEVDKVRAGQSAYCGLCAQGAARRIHRRLSVHARSRRPAPARHLRCRPPPHERARLRSLDRYHQAPSLSHPYPSSRL